jgi:peptidoglycan/LPS O-acetylase OafA/YrhL
MRRIPQLDGLRGIAILMVFATHALHVPMLWMGVDLFFILSGYLITGILLHLRDQREVEGYWGPFYRRRAQRILPPYIGFLIFVGVVFAPRWGHIWYWYAFFGANFPLALGRVPTEAMSPLWSLAVEEQFYLIWPFIVLQCDNARLRQIALSIVILAPLLRAVATPFFSSHFPIYSLTPFRADTLALGAFIAVAEDERTGWIRSMRRPALWGSVVSCVLLLCLSLSASFRTSANSLLFNAAGYSLSGLTFSGALIFVLGSTEGVSHYLLTLTPLRYLGRISYTFYLYHVAVLVIVSRYLNSSTLRAVASLMLTSAIAALSWHVLESPILKRTRRTVSPTTARAVAA